MPSTKAYLDYVLDLLSEADGISHRAMMGEYVLYCRGKVVGGVYDDRFLIKATKSAAALLPHAQRELPYPGAKEMLLVDTEDRALLCALMNAVADELLPPKKKSNRKERK